MVLTTSTMPPLQQLQSTTDLMKGRNIWLCTLANIGNAYALVFISLYLTFGQYLSAEFCFFFATTFLVFAISTVFVLRKRQLSAVRLETFMRLVKEGPIAHRGGAFDAPQNTMLAIREAKKNGASSVEIDLEMTKDGVAVLLHNATVDATTDGSGAIKDMTYAEVRKLNAAAKFRGSISSSFEPIPTVEEAVQECLNSNLNIFFDVKNYSSEMVNFLASLFAKYPHLYNTGMVCSFHPQLIFQVRRKDEQILTALTTEPDFFTTIYERRNPEPTQLSLLFLSLLDFCLVWSIYHWLWYLMGNSAVLLKHSTISQSVVTHWAERGIAVVAWTVNTKEGKDHFTEDLQIPIITDKVKP